MLATQPHRATPRRVLPDPDYAPRAAVVTVARPGQPWFMLSWRSGEVVVTNAAPVDGTIKLFRFATRRQADAAGEVLEGFARLARDGETWLVPGVPEADDDDAACDALIAFHDAMHDRLERRLRYMLTGFYSMRDRIRQRGAR